MGVLRIFGQSVLVVQNAIGAVGLRNNDVDAAAVGAHPDVALGVLDGIVGIVVAQAVGVAGLISEERKTVAVVRRGHLDDAVALAAQPVVACVVLVNAVDAP